MSDVSEYFLASRSSVAQLETLAISHPNFSREYNVVRNARNGLRAQIETGETVDFEWYPLRLNPAGTRQDLDYSLNVILGDLGSIIPTELDRVQGADGFNIKPTVIFRTFQSDVLTRPLVGPIRLEVTAFRRNRLGASFVAQAPALNLNGTGEIYDLPRFPMLSSLL
jgi:hypothetical protein